MRLKFKGEISAGSTDLGVISDKTGQLSSECPLSKEHAIIRGPLHAALRLIATQRWLLSGTLYSKERKLNRNANKLKTG